MREAIVNFQECPDGLMRLPQFKSIFGRYLYQRVSDAYLERLFYAFARNGSHNSGECITFEVSFPERRNIADISVKARSVLDYCEML